MTTLTMLNEFVAQRPGLSFADYGSAYYYRQDYRKILQAKHDYEKLSLYVSNTSISDEDIIKASSSAFSGRLAVSLDSVKYCAGQYMPTEYRVAACAVLASALWDYWRQYEYSDIRAHARKVLGRGIANRYFN